MMQVLAVWIAYSSFDGALIPLLAGNAWTYPLIFLAVALMPGFRAATTLVNNIDKWVDKIQSSLAN